MITNTKKRGEQRKKDWGKKGTSAKSSKNHFICERWKTLIGIVSPKLIHMPLPINLNCEWNIHLL